MCFTLVIDALNHWEKPSLLAKNVFEDSEVSKVRLNNGCENNIKSEYISTLSCFKTKLKIKIYTSVV